MTNGQRETPSLVGAPFASSEFRSKRRQKYLTFEYFEKNRKWLDILESDAVQEISVRRSNNDFKPFGQRLCFYDELNRLLLAYTAGAPIDTVKSLFGSAVNWFMLWHAAFEEYSHQLRREEPAADLRTDGTPLYLADEVEDFQTATTILSLAVLFGDQRAIEDIASALRCHRHEDTMLESLFDPAMPTPSTVDEFYHVKPYDPLLDAIFTKKGPAQASAYVKKYLEGWYKAFDGAYWHDGHLVKKEHMMPYHGYWSFEAAAICVIHDIDDSSFRDHLVYPKDMADWARKNDSIGKLRAAAKQGSPEPRLRCLSGQPCPREGFWFTPARPDSRQRFAQGETMPEIGGDYGATIWQWDDRQ